VIFAGGHSNVWGERNNKLSILPMLPKCATGD
jgi:hypothetical protein